MAERTHLMNFVSEIVAHLRNKFYSNAVDKPKLTLVKNEQPDTPKEHIKAKRRAEHIKGIPQCPICFQMDDYEIVYITGKRTKVCLHCKTNKQRIIKMME